MYIYKPSRVLLDKQIKKCSPYIGGRVLDVGAGTFSRYQNFLSYKEYIKMDISPGSNIDIVGRAEKIPFGGARFDSIVCTQVLGDIKNPAEAIQEFYRVLKPGGVVFLTESFFDAIHDEPMDFWRFTKYGLEHLFKEAGFEILLIDQRGGFFSVMAQSNIRYLVNRFNLHSHSWARIFNPIFKVYSESMFLFDRLDKSQINKNFTIGWCILARRP